MSDTWSFSAGFLNKERDVNIDWLVPSNKHHADRTPPPKKSAITAKMSIFPFLSKTRQHTEFSPIPAKIYRNCYVIVKHS